MPLTINRLDVVASARFPLGESIKASSAPWSAAYWRAISESRRFELFKIERGEVAFRRISEITRETPSR